MKKFSLFMLMAVGLLISGNAWAVNQQNGHNPKNEGDVAKMTVTNTEMGTEKVTYYADLQAAFDDLPTNSYPATITVLKNIEAPIVTQVNDEGKPYLPAWTVPAKCNLTFDLNGKIVQTNTDNDNKSSHLILNKGTLTIKDSQGNGLLSNTVSNPDTDWGEGKDHKYPAYANSVVRNDGNGTVIVESGTIENGTPYDYSINEGALYCIDNTYHANSSVIINGGKLKSTASAVRFNQGIVCNFTMNGGVIEAERMGVVFQNPETTNASYKANFNDGVIFSNLYGAIDMWPQVQDDAPNYEINVNGGTYHYGANAQNGLYMDKFGSEINFNITGGVFTWATGDSFIKAEDGNSPVNKTISGGVYAKSMIESAEGSKLIKPGYTAREITDADKIVVRKQDGTVDNDFDFSNYMIIAPTKQENLDVNGGEINLSEQGKDLDETTDLTITPISGENTTINIDENTKVNKIEVNAPDDKGEAQIVVKNGVTLDVGNGGLVSENNELITVLVETGGTLIIGTGGINKLGDATPIKIQASEEKGTGSLIFSPNAKHEDTKKYAEVDLYTYCKKIGDGKYTWQQFTIPVTELTNDKVVKIPNETSYVFKWDYATYDWSQLSDWAQLDEPFAGYDMTNVSGNGGVVYTFKGDLIGNQNKQLTLPHKDYCVMGNSYTAPIDIVALFAQIDKEMDQTGTGTIEKTVYKYDAKNHYYIYTTELEQELAKAGVMPASFTDIKPMEGFLLNLQSGNTAGVMLNYANAVYTPATTPAASLAPRMNSNTNIVVAKIGIQSAHAMDQMTLVESDEFSADIENGKDAFKYLNEGANLYAFDGTNKLATVATDNLEGTMLAFQAAEDAEYTLTFNRALNTEYVLVDMMNGNEVAMTEGNTYTFFATPNTLDPARFIVKANAQAPTNMENTKATKVAKGIYTITGQYLGESNQWNAMPQGVYMVNGMKVIK